MKSRILEKLTSAFRRGSSGPVANTCTVAKQPIFANGQPKNTTVNRAKVSKVKQKNVNPKTGETLAKPQDCSPELKKTVESFLKSPNYRNCTDTNSVTERKRMIDTNKDVVFSQIAHLQTLSLKELRQLWNEKKLNTAQNYWQKSDYIEEFAYILQEAAFGGLSEKSQARIDEYDARIKQGRPLLDDFERALPVGMILTRDYNGYRHIVKILDDEKVEYDGKVYNSLSAVARHITGKRWNGREFFHVD
jgi:hypothetical protein